MSLRTIGYQDGKPVRVDEGPSAVNWSGPMRGGRIEPDEAPPRTSPADIRSSRRYRAAHPERVRESQRKYRARVRSEVDELRQGRAS